MSPDAFLQMGIVYGYYSLYGDVVAAYEPVLTKVRSEKGPGIDDGKGRCVIDARPLLPFDGAIYAASHSSSGVRHLHRVAPGPRPLRPQHT